MVKSEPATWSAQILSALDASLPVYAVLDGAQDDSIARWAMTQTQAPAWCLYRGALPEELKEVAPYLLRLGRGHGYTSRFFSDGWRRNWGVVFASAAPARELRRHLRRHLRVRTEQGSVLAFRWYDPRVLRAYLPTCTPEELDLFFGPIDVFASPAEQPGFFELFRKTASGLEHSKPRSGEP